MTQTGYSWGFRDGDWTRLRQIIQAMGSRIVAVTAPGVFATINGLTLAAQTVGFTIGGGTTSKILTVDADITASTVNGHIANSGIHFNGTFIVRNVTDAGPMTATDGTLGEIVVNTSDSKFYGCTATGTPATWSALN